MRRVQAPVLGLPAGVPTEELPGLVLLADDEPPLLRALERILRPDGHQIRTAGTPEEIDAALAEPELDVVVLDLTMGPVSGLDWLERIKRGRPDVEVVVMTGYASVESAVNCMRRGAFDYLGKPFDDVHRVRTTVHKAIERRRLLRQNRALSAALRERSAIPELVGNSAPLRALVRKIQSLQHNESHVLINGESGTGKELVARALHANSPRAVGPFIPVDCGALPESIIESELFGHERGAFTGAVGEAPGLFRIAEGGTLFLDEIGEVPLAMQAKLLRSLQYKEVRPVGAARAVPVDIRVISATHRDLARMVEEGHFRPDLFYRLHVIRIEIPPLRERREDILLLVQHFLIKHRPESSAVAGIDDSALADLVAYDWPGNVRELENVVESALALAQGRRLTRSDFSLPHRGRVLRGQFPALALPLSLAAYERCALTRALDEAGGDVAQAARNLGIGRSTFYRKLASHGIKPTSDDMLP